MKLLVGLGNPSPEYAATRHNIGFQAVDEIVHRFSFHKWKNACKGEMSQGTIAGQKVAVLKPHTYMNLSGESVLTALSFFKIKPEDIIVFHDDLALPVGKVKVKIGGSSAGHNGIKNIDSHIGPNYMRVRIGIDQDRSINTVDYVLGVPSPQDQEILAKVMQKMAENVPLLIQGDENNFMNRLVDIQ